MFDLGKHSPNILEILRLKSMPQCLGTDRAVTITTESFFTPDSIQKHSSAVNIPIDVGRVAVRQLLTESQQQLAKIMSIQCTFRAWCQCMRSKNQHYTDGNQSRNNVDKDQIQDTIGLAMQHWSDGMRGMPKLECQ